MNESRASERRGETGLIKAQSTDVAGATASICNAEQARFDLPSGRVGFVHSFSAQPAGALPGWRPEICVIAPDDRWEFVPTHHSLVAHDLQYCLEIGHRCAESAIQSMDMPREIAGHVGVFH